jgi:hypothetical protein
MRDATSKLVLPCGPVFIRPFLKEKACWWLTYIRLVMTCARQVT